MAGVLLCLRAGGQVCFEEYICQFREQLPMSSPHVWKFFRTGGLDQVALETGADLLALNQLNQKLWVALSCPVKRLSLDEKTLALIDADGDGQIRAPELLAAVKWGTDRVKDAGIFLQGNDPLPLDAINEATPEGKILVSSARQILTNLGKPDATAITVAEAADTARIFSAGALNGDGVIPPEATDDGDAQALIKDIILCLGGNVDRTGSTGVTAEQVDKFFTELSAYVDWVGQSGAKDIAILGDATDAACSAIKAVRDKVEDFFARCRLAAFDGRAIEALDQSESEFLKLAAKDLRIVAEEVAEFPLARIEADHTLPLIEGVNPAWAAALATLHRSAVAPIFGAEKVSLTSTEWKELNAKFAAYETWLGGKAGSTVEKLGLARAKEILSGKGREELTALLAKDKALEPEFKAISAVDRLVRYHRDLRALLHNFVNFADFYSIDTKAVFQAGTLYLDSRSCDLCVRVDNPATHATLAAMSKAYIAYVECTRPNGEKMNVAACFTQGDSDYIFLGRHGIFYDRKGVDWDATIIKLIESPISIRQAFWSPYKKFVRFIEEQVAKRAAAADSASTSKLETAAVTTVDSAATGKTTTGKQPNKPTFEVGTVAALGVGLGAIGTLLGGFVAGFLGLGLFMPLGVLGVILAISGPSMLIAWIKLRQRNLGPILDANGWAINGRVKITVPFGTALTDKAVLPKNSTRTLGDPYAEKRSSLRFWVLFIVVVGLAATAIRRDHNSRGRYFWQSAPVAPIEQVVVPAEPAAK